MHVRRLNDSKSDFAEKEEGFKNRYFLYFTGKSRRPVRRHFTAHFDRDNVATRQVSLQNMYSRLVEMAEVLYYLPEPLYHITETFAFFMTFAQN